MTTRPASAAVCPIVSTLLSSLGRTITPLERQRLVERWPSAMPKVGDDATLQRAAFLTDRAVRKYSTETMEAIKVPAMARHLTRVPDRDTAHKLTNEIANYLLANISKNPNAKNTGQLRHAARVCSRTADTIAAYPDHPVQSARHTAGVITAWSAAAGTGIIHELHTIMECLADIR